MAKAFGKLYVLVVMMLIFVVPAVAQTTAPTSITGTSTICNGSSTTLTAIGGALDANARPSGLTTPTSGHGIFPNVDIKQHDTFQV